MIGLSILSGAHMHICPRVMELLKEKGLDDVLVVIGGIIPDVDIAKLNEMGIKGVFIPGTPMQHIVDFINRHARIARRAGVISERRACVSRICWGAPASPSEAPAAVWLTTPAAVAPRRARSEAERTSRQVPSPASPETPAAPHAGESATSDASPSEPAGRGSLSPCCLPSSRARLGAAATELRGAPSSALSDADARSTGAARRRAAGSSPLAADVQRIVADVSERLVSEEIPDPQAAESR